MDNLARATMLWLPSYMVEDDEAVAEVTKANGLIMDFCDRDIELEQVLDEFSTLGISPDDFRETLDFHLRLRGG